MRQLLDVMDQRHGNDPVIFVRPAQTQISLPLVGRVREGVLATSVPADGFDPADRWTWHGP